MPSDFSFKMFPEGGWEHGAVDGLGRRAVGEMFRKPVLGGNASLLQARGYDLPALVVEGGVIALGGD